MKQVNKEKGVKIICVFAVKQTIVKKIKNKIKY